MSSYVAVNRRYVDEYNQSRGPALPCPDIPACKTLELSQLNTPNYFPVCVSGRCRILDIRTSSLSACSSSGDCSLRYGTGCCQSARQAMTLVALSSNVSEAELFCRGDDYQNCDHGCPSPVAPDGTCTSPVAPDGNIATSYCDDTGHCRADELHPL